MCICILLDITGHDLYDVLIHIFVAVASIFYLAHAVRTICARWSQIPVVPLWISWPSTQVGRLDVLSDAICDLFAKFKDAVVIFALVSWNCRHSLRRLFACEVWAGQSLTLSAMQGNSTTILVTLTLLLLAVSSLHALNAISFKTCQ